MQTFLDRFPELVVGFSRAEDGTMALDLGFKRRQAYLAAHGIDPQHVVHGGLVHGTRTVVATRANGGQVVADADGLITAELGVGLAMTAADCPLLFCYDPKNEIIGLVHAGSRGLAAGVLTEFLSTWQANSTSSMRDLVVTTSPSICGQHYTVDQSFGRQFSRWPEAMRSAGDIVHLNLRLVAKAQLVAAGISPNKIDLDPRCTYEDPDIFSYRRDHPPRPQVQLGYIMRRVFVPA